MTPPGLDLEPVGYAALLAGLKARVRATRVRSARAVNYEALRLYWSVGHEILERQQVAGWESETGTRAGQRVTSVRSGSGKWIELTSEYFSRGTLKDLYEQGAFPPNAWNGGDGWGDYDFLLKMFNKRDRDAITDGQHKKIRAPTGGDQDVCARR